MASQVMFLLLLLMQKLHTARYVVPVQRACHTIHKEDVCHQYDVKVKTLSTLLLKCYRCVSIEGLGEKKKALSE